MRVSGPDAQTQLQPGLYDDLGRYPFHNPVEGGLSMSGEGRGCNELAGAFAVDSIAYDAQGLAVVRGPLRPALRRVRSRRCSVPCAGPARGTSAARTRLPLGAVTLAPNDFTHLHVHSEFSLLDGLGRITELVDAAAAAGMDSMAITDHGALYGAVAFYQAAQGQGHQADRRRRDLRRPALDDVQGGQGRQPALPPHPPGQGLPRLPEPVPPGHRRPHRRLLLQAAHRPRPPGQVQRGPHRPVARASAARSPRPSRSRTGSWPGRVAGRYGDIFGKDRFFLELQDHGLPEQRRLNEQLLRLAPEVGLPLVVTNDLHYVREDQSEAHDVLLCVGTGNNLDTPGRLKFETHEFYVKSGGPDGARCSPTSSRRSCNTRRIAEMTDLVLPLGQTAHPALPGARRRDRRVVAAQGVRGAAWSAATGRSRRSSSSASTTSSA